MPLQKKSNDTIYQGREAYVKIDARALHETGEVRRTNRGRTSCKESA